MVEVIDQTDMQVCTTRTPTLLFSFVANHRRHMQQVFSFWSFMRISECIGKFHLIDAFEVFLNFSRLRFMAFSVSYIVIQSRCRRTTFLLFFIAGWVHASILRSLGFFSLLLCLHIETIPLELYAWYGGISNCNSSKNHFLAQI